MLTIDTATQMSSPDLLSGAARLAAEGRHGVADLIALLLALEERKLYAAEGYSSLFRFCVGRLHLSEEEAYYRIAAGRVAARFPVVLERLREGRLTLTAVALLRPHLTEANHEQLLAAAEGRSKREVQVLVAALAPRPDVPTSLRKLPAPPASALAKPGGPDAAAPAMPCGATADRCPPLGGKTPDDLLVEKVGPRETAPAVSPSDPRAADAPAVMGPTLVAPARPVKPAEICPLAPSRYSLRLTISEDTYAKLQRAQRLLGHAVPEGDLAAVLDRALTLLVMQLERHKAGAPTTRPETPAGPASGRRHENRAAAPPGTTAGTPTCGEAIPPPSPTAPAPPAGRSSRSALTRRSRYIPAAVRREVWRRDQARCAYVAPDGHRCSETSRLEFHHTLPFADGGEATPATVEVLCTTHNRWEAQRWFGEDVTTYRGRPGTKQEGGAPRHPGWPKSSHAGIPSPPGEQGTPKPRSDSG